MQEVHRSSQEGVTSHCRAEWGYYWFLEVECPLENSASFPYCHVFKLFFFAFCVFEVECPQQNTDALTLVATLVCHDLVYFCSQRVAFMTLYVFLLLLPLFYLNMNMRASLSYSTQRSCSCHCSCTPPTSSPDYQLCCC